MRRPVPLAEPDAVIRRHLRALPLRCTTLAGRGFLAVFGRPPAQLRAIVRIVGHLELPGPIENVLQRQRPRRTIAARIGYFTRGELGYEHALQLALDILEAL